METIIMVSSWWNFARWQMSMQNKTMLIFTITSQRIKGTGAFSIWGKPLDQFLWNLTGLFVDIKLRISEFPRLLSHLNESWKHKRASEMKLFVLGLLTQLVRLFSFSFSSDDSMTSKMSKIVHFNNKKIPSLMEFYELCARLWYSRSSVGRIPFSNWVSSSLLYLLCTRRRRRRIFQLFL